MDAHECQDQGFPSRAAQRGGQCLFTSAVTGRNAAADRYMCDYLRIELIHSSKWIFSNWIEGPFSAQKPAFL